MKLVAPCHTCDGSVSTRTLNETRLDLARTKGDYLSKRCKNCLKVDQYHVNEFDAVPNRLALFIAIAVFVVGTPLIIGYLWKHFKDNSPGLSFISYGSLILVPGIIYGIVERSIRIKVNTFNSTKI